MYRYSQRISRIILQVYVCAVSDVIYIYIPVVCGEVGGGKGDVLWSFFSLVCAANLSEPLSHYSLFFRQLYSPC